MLSLAGTIQENTVIIENDNITNYDGKEVILTILDHSYKADRKKIDWDKYGMETERGKHVEEYTGEIRNNDRIRDVAMTERPRYLPIYFAALSGSHLFGLA